MSDRQYTNGMSGYDENGRRRSYTEAQARAQGTDGGGIPLNDWEPVRRPAPRQAAGSKKIKALVNSMDALDLSTGTSIREFFEGGRNVLTSMSSEVTSALVLIRDQAEKDAKVNSKWYMLGLDVKRTMRKFDKECSGLADHLMDGAIMFVRCWDVLRTEIIEPMLEGAGRKAPAPTMEWLD